MYRKFKLPDLISPENIISMGRFTHNLYDVAVVGSGPAGASAALWLARQGITVVIAEKSMLPRYKTCGGGIVRRAFYLLPENIQEAIEVECHVVKLNLHDAGLYFSVERALPIISMTMRDTFDFLLVSMAEAAGVEVRSKCNVTDAVFQGDMVKLITSKGPLFARFVIAADGATSLIARRTGWQTIRHPVLALECEALVSNQVLSRFQGEARFDFGIVPYGYAWVFPKKKHISVGVLSMCGSRINLKESLHRYLELIGLSNESVSMQRAFVIPEKPRDVVLVRNRVILAGDAAGFVDSITREGITFAILSGQLAAKALSDGNLEPERVREIYETEITKRILKELRYARVLSGIIYKHPRLRSLLFSLSGQRLCEIMTDTVTGKKTYEEVVRNPFNYFKLFY